MARTIMSFLVGASLLSGCSVAYSSIRQQADGTYLLTESKSKFLMVQATMYHCTATGTVMTCKVVALPSPRK